MNSFEEDVKKHPYKCLEPSFQRINDLIQSENFRICTPNDSLVNDCEITLSKASTKHKFQFEIRLKQIVPWSKFSFEHFGLNQELALIGNKKSLHASAKSVTKISLSLGTNEKEYESLLGELAELDSTKVDDSSFFHRILVPTEKEAETTLVSGTSYTDKKTIYGYGLVTVLIDGNSYHMYRYSDRNEKKFYLILESLQKVSFDTFSFDTDCAIKALSLITGNWYGDERYILRSSEQLFKTIDSIHFRMASYSIISGHKIIDPHGFVEYMNAIGRSEFKNSTSVVPDISFSRICAMLKHVDELERSLFLILEGNKSKSPMSRITSYLVALETLASSISSKYPGHFKTIKNSKLSGKVRNSLIKKLEDFKDDLPPNEYELMTKKLQNINSPSNMDKILKSFELFGIRLSPKMKKIIKTRNVFLHGKTPFEENEVKEKQKELGIDSLRMHMLVSILFLKFCGYSGHIKNLAGWRLYDDNRTDPDFKLTEGIYFTI
ncbi:MAG: hypothetical protein KI791_11815 [Cyclobacteriaceae bacterium]|nr:hypothetical protein [Cyclobacteriaceae bacterium SS2]